MSEAGLLEHAEVIAEIYPTDAVNFVAFDSTFTVEYGTIIKNAVSAVTALKSDQVVIDQMAKLTQDVLNAMSTCNIDYKTATYFVRKAFKNNKAVQNQIDSRRLQEKTYRQTFA